MTANQQTPARAPYRILVGAAGDDTGDWALLEGARLTAGREHCELHVVHVVADEDSPDSDAAIASIERQLAEAPKKLEQRIARLWPDDAVGKVFAHIRPGSPARMILQTASDIDADLIVVGSHRRSGLQRLALGSVADRVLKTAHCPVLVALPKNYEGVEKSESIAPPCRDCMEVRRSSGGSEYWCARHSGQYHAPHVYHPTGRGRNSVMPTY